MKRIILYTGKGGVGKTTFAAATALRAAELGHKTLVISTDAAHSLADSFNKDFSDELTELYPNLFGLEINVANEIEESWGAINDYLTHFLRRRGYEDVVAEELAILPGMDEILSIIKLKEFFDKGRFDTIVVDCAPTGSALRMLTFSDVFKWYMEKLFSVERKVVKTIRPVAERLIAAPLPKDNVYAAVERVYEKIKGLREILSTPEITSIRLVCNPEKMIVKETQRAYTYFNLFGFPMDMVVVNKILPPEGITGSYLEKWIDIQKTHIKEIKDSLAPLPILEAPLFERELYGKELLLRLAGEAFRGNDPAEIFYKGKPLNIRKIPEGYTLSMKMPFASKEDIDLWVKGSELTLKIINVKRTLFLPRTLASCKLYKASFEDGVLKVIFKKT